MYLFSKRLQQVDNTYSNIIELPITPTDIFIHSEKQTVNYIKLQANTDNEVAEINQPSPEFEDNEDLIICPALTTAQ